MRLNPEFNDEPEEEPEDHKVLYISSFNDLPEEQRDELNAMCEQTKSMIEAERRDNPDRDPMITYFALLSLQVRDLSHNLKAFEGNVKMLAEGLDKAFEMINGES